MLRHVTLPLTRCSHDLHGEPERLSRSHTEGLVSGAPDKLSGECGYPRYGFRHDPTLAGGAGFMPEDDS